MSSCRSRCGRQVARTLGAVAALVMCSAASVHAQNVMVFAAASLKDALDDVARAYESTARDTVRVSYASSAALARQIDNGAPADVYIAADLDWMDYVDKRQRVKPGTRVYLLRNELVLAAPAASSLTVDIRPGFPLAQLLGNRRLAMADPDSVPAGKYGRAALEALGVWSSVASRIARAENVRAALLFVSRGEAPLGIVYRTDVVADRNVRIAGVFPAASHAPIVYPMALLTNGKSPGGKSFYDFVTTPTAGAIFRKHGFVPY